MGNVLLPAKTLGATTDVFVRVGRATSSLTLIVGSCDLVICIAARVPAGTHQFASSYG
jgi:hypothetical protein